MNRRQVLIGSAAVLSGFLLSDVNEAEAACPQREGYETIPRLEQNPHQYLGLELFDFSMRNINPNSESFELYLGPNTFPKPLTIINFAATWCQPCIDELPHFEKVYKRYKDKVNFIVQNCSRRRDWDQEEEGFLDNYTLPLLSCKDGVVKTPMRVCTKKGYRDLPEGTRASKTNLLGLYTAALYALRVFPTTLIVNADRKIVQIKEGPMTEEDLEKIIEKNLG